MARCGVVVIVLLILVKEFTSLEFSIPEKYLLPDEKPLPSDLDLYIDALERLTQNDEYHKNVSDSSLTMSSFLSSSFLIRTLDDYGAKMSREQSDRLRKLFKATQSVLDHASWFPGFKEYGLRYVDQALAKNMYAFNVKELPKWVLLNHTMNKYTPQMDNLSLPKEKYVELSTDKKGYHIEIATSDSCLHSMSWNSHPVPHDRPLRRCKGYDFCFKAIFQEPSVAYPLSHRQLNGFLHLMAYRCYFKSEIQDTVNLHLLCAEMYRESVYLARRGFFARDIFMEHIGLCGTLGYEEFHRRRWFLKILTMISEEGCIHENHNYFINRTVYMQSLPNQTVEQIKQQSVNLAKFLVDECRSHEKQVAVIALSAAVRHAAHHIYS